MPKGGGMATDNPFPSGICAKCGGLKIERPDNMPFCSECEKKIAQEFTSKIRPDMGKSKKLVLQSEAYKAE